MRLVAAALLPRAREPRRVADHGEVVSDRYVVVVAPGYAISLPRGPAGHLDADAVADVEVDRACVQINQ